MSYRGVVIEESLIDKSVLEKLTIVETRVEPVTAEHGTPWLTRWTLHTVEVPDDEARGVADLIAEVLGPDSWYADFGDDQTHFVVFPHGVFVVDRSDPGHYRAVVEYGLSLGIPDYQLDFSPAIEQWERPEGG